MNMSYTHQATSFLISIERIYIHFQQKILAYIETISYFCNAYVLPLLVREVKRDRLKLPKQSIINNILIDFYSV